MRISDWSSDVCSSDLLQRKNRKRKKRLASMLAEFQASTAALPDGAVVLGDHGAISWFNTAAVQLLGLRAPQDLGIRSEERRVGKSVSGRVDLGGRRSIKKKTNKNKNYNICSYIQSTEYRNNINSK